MKLYFFLIIMYSSIIAQNSADDIVKTELEFSAMCEKVGVYQSFTNYLLQDAIVLHPGPMPAKDVYKDKPKSGTLIWKPSFVKVSSSGDLGYDTGPWKFSKDTSTAFGHFISVWQKQSNGDWRVIFDGGISHPEIKYDEWKLSLNSEMNDSATKTSLDNNEEMLKSTDIEIAKEAALKGLSEALIPHFSTTIRTYREGKLPAVGIEESKNLLSDTELKVESNQEYSKIAASGDLGYTIGTGIIISDKQKNIGFAYFRIWQNIDNQWKIVLDLFRPYE